MICLRKYFLSFLIIFGVLSSIAVSSVSAMESVEVPVDVPEDYQEDTVYTYALLSTSDSVSSTALIDSVSYELNSGFDFRYNTNYSSGSSSYSTSVFSAGSVFNGTYYRDFTTNSSTQNSFYFTTSSAEILVPLISSNTNNVTELSLGGSFTIIPAVVRGTSSGVYDLSYVQYYYNPTSCKLIVQTDSTSFSYDIPSTGSGLNKRYNLNSFSQSYSTPINIRSVSLVFTYGLSQSWSNSFSGYGLYFGFNVFGSPSVSYSPDGSEQLAALAQFLTERFDVDLSSLLNYLHLIYSNTNDFKVTFETIVSVLNSISSKLDDLGVQVSDIRSYMTIILQSLTSTLNSNAADIVTAIEENIQKVLDEFSESFKADNQSQVESQNQELQSQAAALESAQDAFYGDMSTNFSNISTAFDNIINGSDSQPVFTAIAYIGTVITQVFDSLGYFKYVFLIPLFLSLMLVIVGRLSRSSSTRSSSDRGDGGSKGGEGGAGHS